MNAQSLLVAAMLMAIATAFADTAAKAPTIAKELQQAKTYTISSPPTAPLFTDGGVLVGASSRSNGESLRRPLVRRHLLLLTCVSSTVPSSADVDNTGASTRRRSRLALSRFEKDRTQAAFSPCFLVLAFRRAEVLLFRGIPYPRGTLWLG